MTGETTTDPAIEALKNGEADRQATELAQKKREAAQKEAARWQRELDTLMDRVSHPERDVEYVDLATGQPVPPVVEDGVDMAPPGSLAMPLFFSRAQAAEINQMLARKNEIYTAMADLKASVEKSPDQTGYVKFQVDQLATEMGVLMRKLYATLTARPEITEEWLHENEDKWRPVDLGTLIRRYNQRGEEVMARIALFRVK